MQPVPTPASPLRTKALVCFLVALVTAATWWPRSQGPIDLRWDGGAYYNLGTSLARGQGYRLLSEPGSIPSSLHPPLLPTLVAAIQLGLGTSDPVAVGHALRLVMALASIAYSVAIFLLLAAYVRYAYAFAAACLAVLPPQYVYFSDALYAETLFGLFTVLFFILHRSRARTASFVLSGVCAILAYEARTAGIALLAAWVADCLLRKQFKRALIAAVVSSIPVIAWLGWIKAVEASPEYQQPAYAYQTAPYLYFNVSYARNLALQDPWAPELGPLTTRGFRERVVANLEILPKSVGQAMSSWDTGSRVALPLAMLVLAGLALQARRRQFAMLIYVALSLAAVCSTPFQKQFVRYVMPLYPLFALAMYQLLAWLASGARSRWPSLPSFVPSGLAWSVVAVIGVQVLPALRSVYQDHHDAVSYRQGDREVAYRLFHYAPAGPSFDEALDVLQPRVGAGDVIAAGDPQWVYLRIGRKAVLPPFETNGKSAQALVDTVPVKYLVAASNGPYARFTSPLLEANPTRWNRIWRSKDGELAIYERTDVL